MSEFIGNIIKKDPDATLTYSMGWSDWGDGVTLESATWTCDSGITKVGESINDAPLEVEGVTYAIGTVALVKLSGGTALVDYTCTCRATTTAGDIDERSIIIAVRQR